MKTLDRILLGLAIFLILFITTMIVIFCIKDSIPDTLVTCTMSGGVVEIIVTAWITITKKKCMKESEEINDEMDD